LAIFADKFSNPNPNPMNRFALGKPYNEIYNTQSLPNLLSLETKIYQITIIITTITIIITTTTITAITTTTITLITITITTITRQ
jgi:hypothetical protein